MMKKITSDARPVMNGLVRRWVVAFALAAGFLVPLAGCSFDNQVTQLIQILVRGSLAYPHGFFNI